MPRKLVYQEVMKAQVDRSANTFVQQQGLVAPPGGCPAGVLARRADGEYVLGATTRACPDRGQNMQALRAVLCC
jgi:hypothetical protein